MAYLFDHRPLCDYPGCGRPGKHIVRTRLMHRYPCLFPLFGPLCRRHARQVHNQYRVEEVRLGCADPWDEVA